MQTLLIGNGRGPDFHFNDVLCILISALITYSLPVSLIPSISSHYFFSVYIFIDEHYENTTGILSVLGL